LRRRFTGFEAGRKSVYTEFAEFTDGTEKRGT
jgi:hypothetical protein